MSKDIWVSGIPHSGNRYTKNLLHALGHTAEVHHLIQCDHRVVFPVRDPLHVLLSTWKRSQEPIWGAKFAEWLDKWKKLDDLLARAEDLNLPQFVWQVDKEPDRVMLARLGIDHKGPVPLASREAHWLSDDWITLKNPPKELGPICARWGYACTFG